MIKRQGPEALLELARVYGGGKQFPFVFIFVKIATVK